MKSSASARATLPAVEKVLAVARETPSEFSETALADAVRAQLADLREWLASGQHLEPEHLSTEAVSRAALARLQELAAPRLRSVVNATGVLLHTNLGRAVLSEHAARAAYSAGRSAVNLELDLNTGRRGDRDDIVEDHLCALCGAEAATVVNNNAAAVLLVLNSLGVGREVLVSRGELVEIGGSFRIPEIMAKSGAKLREVGSTNRTHSADYEKAIGPGTAAILKVHTSNYRVVGFTASVSLNQLAAIATAARVPLIEDLGAGALFDTRQLGIAAEPHPRESLRAGADLVTFSGDKLLGGPQSGIIVGSAALISEIKKNPLRRALRCDKMTLAALEATLSDYRFAARVTENFPSLAALGRSLAELSEFAKKAERRLSAALGASFRVQSVDAVAEVGSGSQPGVELPSRALAVSSAELSVDAVARRFREADPPILGRIFEGRFLLDLRLIRDEAELVPSWAEGSV